MQSLFSDDRKSYLNMVFVEKNKKSVAGELHISTSVFEDIAAVATENCYGVIGTTSPDGFSLLPHFLPKCLRHKGVVVESTPDGIKIDVYVIMEYGTNIRVVAQNLSDQVRFEIKKFCDAKVDAVNIHIKGMRGSR